MQALLELRDVVTAVAADDGVRDVLSGVSLSVYPGESVALVGESGCGKSMTALSVMGLLGKGARVRAGSIFFDGKSMLDMNERELDGVRGSALSMIYQDALGALNPVLTVGDQIRETVRAHTALSRREARERALALLSRMELPDPVALMKKYPHMLSGGQRQRVMIAMALCCSPRLVIADEPTTALDVTVQAGIMRTLREEQQRTGMSLLLISHDVGLVAQTCDRVLVMYAGQIVEAATVKELFTAPAHPYTQMLLRSVPGMHGARETLCAIPGQVPACYGEMGGCRFASRCPYASAACEQPQPMTALDDVQEVRCHVALKRREAAI